MRERGQELGEATVLLTKFLRYFYDYERETYEEFMNPIDLGLLADRIMELDDRALELAGVVRK
jgi:hypothetical protein